MEICIKRDIKAYVSFTINISEFVFVETGLLGKTFIHAYIYSPAAASALSTTLMSRPK